MNSKNLVEWTTANFDQELTHAGPLVVVDFYAPWCGPCRMLTPLLNNLAAQFTGRIRFAKVNVDQAPDLAQRFEITGVPTLLVFRNGELQDEIVGLPSPKALASRLENLASEPSAETGAACQECSWDR